MMTTAREFYIVAENIKLLYLGNMIMPNISPVPTERKLLNFLMKKQGTLRLMKIEKEE